MKKNVSSKAFILNLPRELRAKEVVAKGRARGLKFSAAYVYTVRRKALAVAPEVAVVEAPRPVRPRPGIAKVRPETMAAFRKAAAELGIGKALELLNADAAVLAFYRAGS